MPYVSGVGAAETCTVAPAPTSEAAPGVPASVATPGAAGPVGKGGTGAGRRLSGPDHQGLEEKEQPKVIESEEEAPEEEAPEEEVSEHSSDAEHGPGHGGAAEEGREAEGPGASPRRRHGARGEREPRPREERA